jgi:hypothetical protein
MRIPWLARQYERSCKDCGHVWYVPKAFVRPRRQGLPMRGNMAGGAAAVGQVIAANAALAERAAAFCLCPKCESTNYKQRRSRS